MVKKDTNESLRGKSIASLVLGICALLFGFIPVIGWIVSILAVVFGLLVVTRIKDKKKFSDVLGMGVAGLVMGGIGLIYGLVIFFMIFMVANVAMFSLLAPLSVEVNESTDGVSVQIESPGLNYTQTENEQGNVEVDASLNIEVIPPVNNS